MRKRVTTMAPTLARAALIQLSRADLAGVLGYAEGLGLVAAALGVWGDPATVVRTVCLATVAGATPWDAERTSLPEHLRDAVWQQVETRIHRVALAQRAHAPSTDVVRLSAVQLGSLDGVIRAARWAATRLADDRRTDREVLELADLMLREVHRELQVIIQRAEAASEDTAPIVRVVRDDRGDGGDGAVN
ncbi:MAG: hypothetical protein R3B06_21245 [Kofleriaceae bacterium]